MEGLLKKIKANMIVSSLLCVLLGLVLVLLPGLSVLIMALISYVLMVKKKWTVNKMMLFFLIVAVVGYFTTILTV